MGQTASSKQSKNSKESIKDLIEECPVCLNILKSKTIYQCENGHAICDQCYSKFTAKNCPTCTNVMFKTRNLVSEKILEKLPTPCQFVGCSEESMLNELKNHEQECLFRLVDCVQNCELKKPLNEIIYHIKKYHNIFGGQKITHSPLSSSCEGKLSLEIEDIYCETSWIPITITHDGHEFFLERKRQTNGIWYNWVCILGSQRIADKYQCVMSYIDNDGDDVLMYKGNVISIDVSKEDRPKKEGSVFGFLDLMVRDIWNTDDEKISYKLTIQNK